MTTSLISKIGIKESTSGWNIITENNKNSNSKHQSSFLALSFKSNDNNNPLLNPGIDRSKPNQMITTKETEKCWSVNKMQNVNKLENNYVEKSIIKEDLEEIVSKEECDKFL